MAQRRVDDPSPRRARDPEELLTVEEAATECGVHQDTIRRHIHKGALDVIRLGGYTIRIRRAALQRYRGESDG